jgi:peptidoglycan/xylan/chitin deacetylase (PgdA/CDA1 family)
MYHHVAPDREVTPAGFEAQLAWLKRRGLRTLSLQEFLGHVTGEKPVDDPAVLLTFDDGYADNWICAWPLLKRHGMRAAVFVVTDRADAAPPGVRPTLDDGAPPPDTLRDERGPRGFLSWEELGRMASSGVFEVGSHTATHRGFVRENPLESISGELSVSMASIEGRLKTRPLAVAWPWGDYSEAWPQEARKAGYRLAFTTRVGANAPGTDPLRIRRFKVRDGSLASRIWLYRKPALAEIYGRVYGLDKKIKEWFLE